MAKQSDDFHSPERAAEHLPDATVGLTPAHESSPMFEHGNRFVALLTLWYSSYTRIIVWLGTVAVTLLGFSATFIVKDVILGLDRAAALSFRTLYISWGCFAASFLSCSACLLFTYNWYIAAINNEIQKTPFDRFILKEDFTYRKHMGSMKGWGWWSWVAGWCTGLLLLFGIGFFVFGMIDLMPMVTKDIPALSR